MIERIGGELVGPVREPVNASADAKGSIHDDATASRLGLRGGTVAGDIHLELTPPVLVEAFGREWFETGCVSMQFRNATTDREPVRVYLGEPASRTDAQAPIRIVRTDGMLVGEGTASVGSPAEPSALHAKDLNRFEAGELDLLADISIGDRTDEVEAVNTSERQRKRLDDGLVSEPLDWYFGPSPWGGPIASPVALVQLLYADPTAQLGRRLRRQRVGLFGAIELRHLNGPVFLDTAYRISAEVVAVGQSPRTEYLWFDATASLDERPIAVMRMQMRWMKEPGAT